MLPAHGFPAIERAGAMDAARRLGSEIAPRPGAGPVALATSFVGLSAALALSRSGYEVRIVDQSAEPGSESRAAVVNARTLDLLDYFGVAADLIDTALEDDAKKNLY